MVAFLQTRSSLQRSWVILVIPGSWLFFSLFNLLKSKSGYSCRSWYVYDVVAWRLLGAVKMSVWHTTQAVGCSHCCQQQHYLVSGSDFLHSLYVFPSPSCYCAYSFIFSSQKGIWDWHSITGCFWESFSQNDTASKITIGGSWCSVLQELQRGVYPTERSAKSNPTFESWHLPQ